MLRNITKIGLSGLAFAPLLVFAQATFTNVDSSLRNFNDLVELAVPIIFGLAIVFFLWGLAKFVLAAGDEEAKATGKRIMIWGIVAIAVMASVWGLVAFLQSAFGVGGSATPTLPGLPALP